MDASSIVTATAGTATQVAAPQPGPSKAVQTARPVSPARDVKLDKAAEDDVRTRDPRSLQYQVDGSTKQVVATIVDESNKTVVVQIPNEEVLRIAKAIDRMQGFLLESKA